MSEILLPFQSLHHGTTKNVSGVWERYVALMGVEEENHHLRQRLSALEAENSMLIEAASELKRLQDLLEFSQQTMQHGLAAQVIGWDPSNWSRTLVVNQGSTRGIIRGMPVLQDKGVVGQVIGVGLHSSRVMLITDRSSGVDAIIQGTRLRGVVEGKGSGLCDLSYVSRDTDDEIKIGDRVITSGMDGVFPKGLLIGIVKEHVKNSGGLFQAIKVKPSVDFDRLETVLIAAVPSVDLKSEVPEKSEKK